MINSERPVLGERLEHGGGRLLQQKKTKKFKKRIRKLISFLLKINNIISHKKRIEQKKNEIWTPFN